MNDNQEQTLVFQEVYERLEQGLPIPIELEEKARNHGIRIEAVEEAALACEDDFDEESL